MDVERAPLLGGAADVSLKAVPAISQLAGPDTSKDLKHFRAFAAIYLLIAFVWGFIHDNIEDPGIWFIQLACWNETIAILLMIMSSSPSITSFIATNSPVLSVTFRVFTPLPPLLVIL